jgi:hypothetical protein
MLSSPGEIFIAAQKRPLDRGVIDMKCVSDGPDGEVEFSLGSRILHKAHDLMRTISCIHKLRVDSEIDCLTVRAAISNNVWEERRWTNWRTGLPARPVSRSMTLSYNLSGENDFLIARPMCLLLN